MPDSYDLDHLPIVVNLVTNSPVAHTNTPKSFFGFYLKASVWEWIVRKGQSYR